MTSRLCVRVTREREARLIHSLYSCVPPHCIRCELAPTVHWAHLPFVNLLPAALQHMHAHAVGLHRKSQRAKRYERALLEFQLH